MMTSSLAYKLLQGEYVHLHYILYIYQQLS